MRRFSGSPIVMVRCPSGASLRIHLAGTFASRLAGLALLPSLPHGAGLLIPRCRSVHTIGIRFAIDVVFLEPAADARWRVLETQAAIGPMRFVRLRRSNIDSLPGSVAALELCAGEAAQLSLASGAELRLTSGRRRFVQAEPSRSRQGA
jgi:hypothetical protein